MTISIRDYHPDDAAALFAVFYSAVHDTAADFYSAAQINAWAPAEYDMARWQQRLNVLRPFIALSEGEIAGYADVQAAGYIDHFFVAASHGGCGIGSALMNHILHSARERQLTTLSADASEAAERFFRSHGFVVVQRNTPVLNGVVLTNARMERQV